MVQAFAAENIGAIAYYSGRRILDMNGLISPQMIPYKRRGRVEEYLAAHPPDYLIKIHPQRDPWSGGVIGLDLEPIQVLAYEHMFINQKDPLYYTLYRVLGSVEERARPGRASSAADMVR